MALKPPRAGLRPVHYNSNQVGKIDLRVQPGDELHVPEAMAEQLLRDDSHFREGSAPDELLSALGLLRGEEAVKVAEPVSEGDAPDAEVTVKDEPEAAAKPRRGRPAKKA